MQNISFGRIFKVNASQHVSKKIVNSVKRDLQGFKAYTYPVSNNESYIFTGQDAAKYEESLAEYTRIRKNTNTNLAEKMVADEIIDVANMMRDRNVKAIIEQQSGDIIELKVKQNKSGEIKSINIII